MSLFTGTIDYYRQFRPGIPREVADIFDAAARHQTPRRLLDVGTGTGLVVEACSGGSTTSSPTTTTPRHSRPPTQPYDRNYPSARRWSWRTARPSSTSRRPGGSLRP